MSVPRLRVLYIAGSGRSGTTLVSRILGQLDAVAAIGELRNLWLIEPGNELCGCGRVFGQCPFWRAVFDAAAGGMEKVDFDAILALRQSVDRVHHIPRMLWSRRGSDYRQRLDRYRAELLRFYRAIQAQSGCEVILDASKHAATLYLLAGMPEIELYILHQVRDSRAVAHSWMRKKPHRKSADGTGYMKRHTATQSARSWIYQNVLASAARRRGAGYLCLRYEDFVADPVGWTRKIAGLVGIDDADLGFLAADHVDFTVDSHTAYGNPMRFEKGRVVLKPDDSWHEQMNPRSKALTTALTWPLLWRHGYLRRS